DFYSVFEGFESLDSLNFEEDVFENIEYLLLKNYLHICKGYFKKNM
ncbi:hypothetical protein M3L28_001835, partial [Campylobacter coli]|nr:hypothetical protein [Campylobacter coli]